MSQLNEGEFLFPPYSAFELLSVYFTHGTFFFFFFEIFFFTDFFLINTFFTFFTWQEFTLKESKVPFTSFEFALWRTTRKRMKTCPSRLGAEFSLVLDLLFAIYVSLF